MYFRSVPQVNVNSCSGNAEQIKQVGLTFIVCPLSWEGKDGASVRGHEFLVCLSLFLAYFVAICV